MIIGVLAFSCEPYRIVWGTPILAGSDHDNIKLMKVAFSSWRTLPRPTTQGTELNIGPQLGHTDRSAGARCMGTFC